MLKSESSSSSTTEVKPTRRDEKDEFSGPCYYVISLLGQSVGISDFWRFPYLVYRNGGGAFIIPFILTMILCGLPLFFLETAMSQFSGKGPMNIWQMSPFFQGIGFTIMFMCSTYSVYANIMRVWIMEYLISSFSKELPWAGCHHPWNTPGCIDLGYSSSDHFLYNGSIDNYTTSLGNMPVHTHPSDNRNQSGTITKDERSTITMSSSEQFWQYNVLELTPGLHDLGSIKWRFVLFLLIWRIVISACLINSIKWLEKIMFGFLFIPIALMLAVWIRALTLEGAVTGMLYYVTPDFRRLADVEVWIEAAFMSFYTLGPAWGPLILLGSRNKFRSNCYRHATVVAVLDTVSALMNGLICFSVLGVMAHKAQVELQNVVTSGMSLGFTVYPVALTYFPVPQLWSAIFFINLLVVGLDGLTVLLEVVIDCIQELWSIKIIGYRRLVVLVFLNMLYFSMSIPFCTQGGAYIFLLVDWYALSCSLLFTAFLECAVFMWFYGGDRISHDLEIMLGRSIPTLIRVAVAFITPAIIMVLLVLSLMRYKPPTYGKYNYPAIAQVFGWCLAFLMVCPIPIVLVLKLYKTPGTLKEKFIKFGMPSLKWGPSCKVAWQTYSSETKRNRTLWSTLIFNWSGKDTTDGLVFTEEEMTNFSSNN